MTETEAIEGVMTPGAMPVAGGTSLIDLLRLGVATPARLIDVNHLPWADITSTPEGLSIGALARNSDTAHHPEVRSRFPALSEALLSGASAQLRNMASTAGNIMQRTRCPYFRDVGVPDCNKRSPGSGCAAQDGWNRPHAVLGGSRDCIAVNPSDMCVALVALDAVVHTRSALRAGETAGAIPPGRHIPIADFHLVPGSTPDRETVLQPGELITHVTLPATAMAVRSRYVKVRDRASYAFALASAATALEIQGGQIRAARVVLGGVATKPWRSRSAEQALLGRAPGLSAFREAATAAMNGAEARPHNAFKIELARVTIVRALERSMGPA